MPGLFGQAILFGSNSVAVGIATDMSDAGVAQLAEQLFCKQVVCR